MFLVALQTSHFTHTHSEVLSPLEDDYRQVALDYFNLVFGNTPAAKSHWSTDIITALNARFIALRPRERGVDLRAQLRMGKVLSRVQELTGVSFTLQANRRIMGVTWGCPFRARFV